MGRFTLRDANVRVSRAVDLLSPEGKLVPESLVMLFFRLRGRCGVGFMRRSVVTGEFSCLSGVIGTIRSGLG